MPPLFTPENLYIYESKYNHRDWLHIVDITLWLELSRPFTAVKNLHLPEKVALYIVPVLQELVGDRTTEVLQENILQDGKHLSFSNPVECFLGGPSAVENCPGRYLAVRCRATGHQSPDPSFSLG
jgi:hypothetical protein